MEESCNSNKYSEVLYNGCFSICLIENIIVEQSDIVKYYGDELENHIRTKTPTFDDFRRDYDAPVYLDNDQFNGIIFKKTKIPFIPARTFHLMKNIQLINASYSGIEKINEHDFSEAHQLTTLCLSHNKIPELGSFLFSNSSSLRIVDFSHNYIENIQSNTFSQADEIASIDLSHNRIQQLDLDIFSNLRIFGTILLNHNELKTIDSSLFAENKMLNRILLSYNQIITINCTTFSSSSSYLHLEYNPLNQFDAECFHDFNVTQDYQHYRKFILQSFLDAKYLNVSNTRIIEVVLPKDIQFTVSKLSMRDSNVINLQLFLNHFEQLRNCSLKSFSFGAFSHQERLTILDISYNDLKKIDFHIFLPTLHGINIYLV